MPLRAELLEGKSFGKSSWQAGFIWVDRLTGLPVHLDLDLPNRTGERKGPQSAERPWCMVTSTGIGRELFIGTSVTPYCKVKKKRIGKVGKVPSR